MSDKIFLLTPVIAMLHNVKEKTFHPILYVESPLPGPMSEDKVMRHKSKGHRTVGLKTRDEALKTIAAEIEPRIEGTLIRCLDPDDDLLWDGEDVPADVAFFEVNPDHTARRIM